MEDGSKSFLLQAHRTHAVGGNLHGRLRTTAYAWVHGTTEDWNRRRIIRNSDRAQASQRLTHPHRIEGFTHARDSTRAGRHDSCAGRAKRFGQNWSAVLDGLVDWWSASSVGVARWSADGSTVLQLSKDLRPGTLARRRCHDSLVHLTERSDRDSSSGETDRADGRAMYCVDVSARFHSKRSCQVGFGRDKGGE